MRGATRVLNWYEMGVVAHFHISLFTPAPHLRESAIAPAFWCFPGYGLK